MPEVRTFATSLPRRAETGHESSTCISENLKCPNCSGSHAAFSRSCPKWLTEKQIQATKVKQNISYAEARKIVVAQTPKLGVSYSSVLQQKADIGIQYDLDDLKQHQSFLFYQKLQPLQLNS
ncbi:hypothetical protein AVEN_11235-1 [Araneus ventricosus]|uniref:Uncharacterized protein n=1 Tax=Araneus ventricosus TaxID=182803 RepID=A0A4Y2RNI0_ARAVE|nr:hypothetical protein AVEN_11235-1 [Araneus ventricosus]